MAKIKRLRDAICNVRLFSACLFGNKGNAKANNRIIRKDKTVINARLRVCILTEEIIEVKLPVGWTNRKTEGHKKVT